jgi:hypothetical protein
MIIVHCGDGSEEQYENLEELKRELEMSASEEYTETVLSGLRRDKRVAVPNSPGEIDIYEITD